MSEEKTRGMRCQGCGCSDDNACKGGCHWVDKNLCSECAELCLLCGKYINKSDFKKHLRSCEKWFKKRGFFNAKPFATIKRN